MTFTNKNKWSTSLPNVIGSPSQLPTTKLVSTGGLVGIRQATYQMGGVGGVLSISKIDKLTKKVNSHTQSQAGNSGAGDQVLFH